MAKSKKRTTKKAKKRTPARKANGQFKRKK